ncbi:hypothetical protein N656DRAFT_131335 [Canariomyces notabilis]|uniref:Uncharacterized protein n=1 Tax=Canariomyces notabilis TaxID=2074819 RepID=A0AAN6TCN4_9PEZI|nr:hypothetical protein N656DRAFT_131335 [Canariomyces arenarius]
MPLCFPPSSPPPPFTQKSAKIVPGVTALEENCADSLRWPLSAWQLKDCGPAHVVRSARHFFSFSWASHPVPSFTRRRGSHSLTNILTALHSRCCTFSCLYNTVHICHICINQESPWLRLRPAAVEIPSLLSIGPIQPPDGPQPSRFWYSFRTVFWCWIAGRHCAGYQLFGVWTSGIDRLHVWSCLESYQDQRSVPEPDDRTIKMPHVV